MKPVDQFGPIYPDLGAGVAKLRRGKDRKAHGEAVLEAIRAKQAASLRGVGVSMPAPHCASGTTHVTGTAILTAIRASQRTALQAHVAKVRRDRTRFEWASLYQRAMVECGKARS